MHKNNMFIQISSSNPVITIAIYNNDNDVDNDNIRCDDADDTVWGMEMKIM